MTKKIYFTFGRFNPPSVAHEDMIKQIISMANNHGADHALYISHTTGSDKNPLDYSEKVQLISHAIPELNIGNAKHPYLALETLAKEYDDIVFIVGSDRESDFSPMYDYAKQWGVKYFKIENYSDRESGKYPGVSSTKIKELVRSNNYKEFKRLVMSGISSASKTILFQKLRKRLHERN